MKRNIPEQIEAVRKAGALTKEQAEFIRECRVDREGTWRYVAGACYDEGWDNFDLWGHPGDQITGMDLCEAAAKMFNEDYMQEPWN